MIKTAASLLDCNLTEISAEISRCRKAEIDWIHFDVMDGVFVDRISYGSPILKSIRSATDMFLDVHLMVENPMPQIKLFAEAGASLITIHIESYCDAEDTLKLIRTYGIKSAVALKPDTPIEAVYGLLPLCDMVLVMTVEPGYGGQSLIPSTIEKIMKLRAHLDELGYNNIDIEADGGINAQTAPLVKKAGATVLVSGTGLFGSPNMKNANLAIKA